MPELPEVETILKGLRAALVERRIVGAEVRKDLRWPVPDDLSMRTQGKKIRSVARLGKYGLIALVHGPTILIHLGMSGRLRITAGDQVYQPARHEHITVTLENGVRFGFVDPRRFGCLLLLDAGREYQHPLLKKLGPDPMRLGFDADYLHQKLRSRRVSIKAALLDQHVVAGLGNIYVSEILFRARVHPERMAFTLDKGEIGRLADITPRVLQEAISAGGSTLRDYVDTEGKPGAFQDLHQVYGREGQSCPECPGHLVCPGIRRLIQGGRSSFYCARLQPMCSTQGA